VRIGFTTEWCIITAANTVKAEVAIDQVYPEFDPETVNDFVRASFCDQFSFCRQFSFCVQYSFSHCSLFGLSMQLLRCRPSPPPPLPPSSL
jgi:hypothetical protein